MQVFLIYFVDSIFFFFEKLVMLYMLPFQHNNGFDPGQMKHDSRKCQKVIDDKNNLFYSFVRL